MCRALGAVPFSSESEMVRDFLHVLEMPYSTKQVLAGIVFTKVPPVCRGIPESNLEYKLRFPSTLRSGGGKFSMSPFGRVSHWMTQYMFPVFQKVGPRKAHSIQGGPPGRNALLKYGTVHTHTHLTALFPGLPGWASTRKVKPIWILLKQETVSGSGISWAKCKSAPRSRQITVPAPHHSVFLQAGCPSCRPTNSVKALKALKYGTVHSLHKCSLLSFLIFVLISCRNYKIFCCH